MIVACCFGSAGDNNFGGTNLSFAMTTRGLELNGVWVNKPGSGFNKFNPITGHLVANHVNLGAHHLLHSVKEIFYCNVVLNSV